MNIANFIAAQLISLVFLQFLGIDSSFIKSKYQELLLFVSTSLMGIFLTKLFFPIRLSVLQSNSEIEEKKDTILIAEGNPLSLRNGEDDRSVTVTVNIEQSESSFMLRWLYKFLVKIFDLSIYIKTTDLKIQPKSLQDSRVEIIPGGIKIKLAEHLLNNAFLGINAEDPLKVTYVLDLLRNNLGEKRNYYIKPMFTLGNNVFSKFLNWSLEVLFHCKDMEIYKVYYKEV